MESLILTSLPFGFYRNIALSDMSEFYSKFTRRYFITSCLQVIWNYLWIVDMHQLFRGTLYLHYKSIWFRLPEDNYVHIYFLENLNFHTICLFYKLISTEDAIIRNIDSASLNPDCTSIKLGPHL